MNTNFVAKSELPDVSPQEKFSVFLGVDAGNIIMIRIIIIFSLFLLFDILLFFHK